jgi:hypothetical protein
LVDSVHAESILALSESPGSSRSECDRPSDFLGSNLVMSCSAVEDFSWIDNAINALRYYESDELPAETG